MFRCLQIGFHVFRGQDLHLQLPGFWDDAVLTGVPGDQPLLHRPLQSTVEHQMDAVDGGGAQSLILVFSDVYSAALQ